MTEDLGYPGLYLTIRLLTASSVPGLAFPDPKFGRRVPGAVEHGGPDAPTALTFTAPRRSICREAVFSNRAVSAGDCWPVLAVLYDPPAITASLILWKCWRWRWPASLATRASGLSEENLLPAGTVNPLGTIALGVLIRRSGMIPLAGPFLSGDISLRMGAAHYRFTRGRHPPGAAGAH